MTYLQFISNELFLGREISAAELVLSDATVLPEWIRVARENGHRFTELGPGRWKYDGKATVIGNSGNRKL